MSFDTIKNNIKLIEDGLETGESISIDSLLESIEILIEDAQEENKKLSIPDFSISNEDYYVKHFYRLLSFLHTEHSTHAEVIKELLSSYDEYIKEAEKELTELSIEIKQDNEVVEKKRRKADELNKEKGHLLELEQENNYLQEKINKLNDPYLDSLDSENKKLKSDLKSREAKETKLKNDNFVKEKAIQGLENRITELEGKETTLKQKKLDKEKERDRLETGVLEIESWIDSFDKWFDSIDEEIKNASAKMDVIQNGWNSVNTSEYTVSQLPEDCEETDKNSDTLKEIIEWFDTEGKDIDKRIEEYRLRLKAVVEATEKIMKPVN